jgi:flagellar protein FliO/FliZ
VLLAPPLGAQAKGSGTAASPADPATTSVGGAPIVDESKTPLGGAGTAAGTTVARTGSTSGVTTWDFIRMILILVVVVVIIYLVFWVIRKGSGRKVQENDLIKVLGSRGLQGSRALHLVEVGTSIYLVGSADGGVDLIAEITDKESIDSLKLKSAEANGAAKRTFPQILSEIFRPAKGTFSVGEGLGLLKNQRDRLKKL